MRNFEGRSVWLFKILNIPYKNKMKVRYFDHAATTPVREEVIKEMIPYFGTEYGNASAMYSIGRNAKRAINIARRQVAEAINCEPSEVYFTSCGSESR